MPPTPKRPAPQDNDPRPCEVYTHARMEERIRTGGPLPTAPTQEVRPVLRPRSSRVVTLPLSGIDHEAAVEALADLYASGAVSPEVAGAVAVLLGCDAERGTPHPDVIRLLRGLVVSFETRAGGR